MPHVITDLCTKCMNCASICPVSCIHPSEGEADLEAVTQLYIHPEECIDCGACVPECPVTAIFPLEELPVAKRQCADANVKYYQK